MGRSLQEIDAQIAALTRERADAAAAARPECPKEIDLIVDTARAAAMYAMPMFYDGRGWGVHITHTAVYHDCGTVAKFNAAVFTMDEYDILVRRISQ